MHRQLTSKVIATLPGSPKPPRGWDQLDFHLLRDDASWQRFAAAARVRRPPTLPAGTVAVVLLSSRDEMAFGRDATWRATGDVVVVSRPPIRTDSPGPYPAAVIWVPSDGFRAVRVDGIGEIELASTATYVSAPNSPR